MMRWLSLVLAGLGVCLLLALGQAKAGKGMEPHSCLARWDQSLGAWGEPAPASPTAASAQNPGPCNTPLEVSHPLPVELMLLTECDVGPPGLDSRGPPGKARGAPVDPRAAGQTGSPKRIGELVLPQQGPSSP